MILGVKTSDNSIILAGERRRVGKNGAKKIGKCARFAMVIDGGRYRPSIKKLMDAYDQILDNYSCMMFRGLCNDWLPISWEKHENIEHRIFACYRKSRRGLIPCASA